MKKFSIYIFIVIILIGIFSPVFSAKAQVVGNCTLSNGETVQVDLIDCQSFEPPGSWSSLDSTPQKGYHLLEPLPCEAGTPNCEKGELTDFNPDAEADPHALGTYLNFIIRLFIGLCAVLAVVMIVIGGIEYSTSELVSSKEAGKDRILGALGGLLLALGAYTLLFTVNPDLLNTDVDISGATLAVEIKEIEIAIAEENTAIPFQPVAPNRLQELGIKCDSGGSLALASTAQSFIGKVAYDRGARNTIANGKAVVDCSSFIAQVYKCAGLNSPGGTTSEIFSTGQVGGVTSISRDGTAVNGISLKVGDLLGWKAGDSGIKFGHVFMYIGNGQMIDMQRAGVATRSVTYSRYTSKIKYIKRI